MHATCRRTITVETTQTSAGDFIALAADVDTGAFVRVDAQLPDVARQQAVVALLADPQPLGVLRAVS